MDIRTFVFIDASNLFYGGLESLGWSIDYNKLKGYLRDKYNSERFLYFGGVETHNFKYDFLKSESVELKELQKYLKRELQNGSNLIEPCLRRVNFFLRLEKFGYELYLKPVKSYYQENGSVKKKANCDVEMAFYLMKEKDNFDRVVFVSGDGDFLPVLKYLKVQGKEIIVLARGKRTAKEIRRLAGDNFRDFDYLKNLLQQIEGEG